MLAIKAKRSNKTLYLFASIIVTAIAVIMAERQGVVDSDYRGEIKVPLINNGNERFFVTNEMRIAQIVVTPVLLPEIKITDSLDDTERSGGGFGSTGQ